MKILLAIDDSQHSAAAINLLARISWPAKTLVYLLAIVPEHLPLMESGPGAHDPIDEELEILRWRQWSAARMLTTQAAAKLKAHNLLVETAVCEGHPTHVLLEQSSNLSVDLIVVGATSFDTLEFRLSAAAQEFVNCARCSVLVARPSECVRPLSTVLVIDDSPESWNAVELLCALSLPNWAKLTVINLAQREVNIPLNTNPHNYYPLTTALGGSTTKVIEHLQTYDVRVARAVRFGGSADEVLSVAEEEAASLIVLGVSEQAYAASPAESTVEKMMKYAPCSVLAVRKERTERYPTHPENL
jgi:nucleotide-binding universal stress UspA family protein